MRETALNESDVRTIIATAPRRYKTYEIPKRRGDGVRIISQPASEVKIFQRVLVEEIISRLPVHSAAKAYCAGISIRDNAAAHAANGPILKFDFSNFFPSITDADWVNYCSKFTVFEREEDIALSVKILFKRALPSSNLRLAIGAPSSPTLSNVLMYEFDEIITQAVAKDHVTYTRYADDLTFSAKRTGHLSKVGKTLRRTINEISSPSLKLNEEKTVFATKKYRRVVTGLVLADDGTVSLGRDRKRLLRAAIHHYCAGRLTERERRRLGGWLAFVNAVEPSFIERLNERYGQVALEQIRALSSLAQDE